MVPVVSWVSENEEEGRALRGLKDPMKGVGEVGGTWEGFDDEVEDE